MPVREENLQRARNRAQEELGKDPAFRQLSKAQQFDRYKQRVDQLSQQFAQEQSLAEAMAAGDLVDDARHLNRRIDQQGAIAGRVLREVNFPQFVKDLLQGVFDANLEVMREQMDSYADLVERITAPATKFIHTIDDATAYAFLAERQPDSFQLLGSSGFGNDPFADGSFGNLDGTGNLDATGAGTGADANTPFTLGDANGNPVDIASEDIRGQILQAKLQLVREHQQLLEEMLLMGVTRMVVDNGKVKASVDFRIQAQEQIGKVDSARENSRKIRRRSSGSFWFFGGHQTTTQQSTLSVSTANVQSRAATTSGTQVHGEVEINFKSDYFELNNFRDILLQRAGAKGAGPTKYRPK